MELSGALARTLFDLSPDSTIVVDAAGTVVFANAQVAQTFGYEPAELIGASIETLLPERFRGAHAGHRGRFVEHPKLRPMGAGLTLRGLHKDGREFPVEISLSPVSTEEGILIVAAVRDATVRQKEEDRLVEANRAKSRFLAAASHDLRQPLQTLNLLNRAATRQAGEGSALRGILDRQQRALDSMSSLLASVLDISKLDSGAVVATPKAFPIDEIFDRLKSDYEPQATDKGLALVFERSAETGFTDPELLLRMVGNLVSNAIRYTHRGSVRIACAARESELVIEVRDTGIGIPAEELERIFQEFYQIDRSAQRPEGLGLGLSIVKRLAALLHCPVDVESVPGEGTAFRVTLARAERATAEPHATREPETGGGGRILVVDDETEVAEAIALLLELEGFAVQIASCERDALAAVLTGAPDIVVSDYHLRGGETGLKVVTAVRERLRAPVPVVFLTGDTARVALDESKLDHALILSKPVRAEELLAAVRAQLKDAA